MMATALEMLERFGRFIDFSGRALASMAWALARKPAEVLRQFERVAWGSLPIILAAGVSIGLVAWFQTRRQLAAYGLEANLPSLLAVFVILEVGPVFAGLMIAGRMGAGLAAELASMTLTEEIDARTILGAPPIPSLVAPRVLACAVAVPLLTVLIDAAALASALGIEQVAGTVSAQVFARRSLDFLYLHDVLPATLKTAVFGLLVGLVGCWCGLHAEPSTEAVGRAATHAVVRAMLAVFAANVLLVPWIQWAVAVSGWSSA